MEGIRSQNSSWVNPVGMVRWWVVGSESGRGLGIEEEGSGFGSAIGGGKREEQEKGKGFTAGL